MMLTSPGVTLPLAGGWLDFGHWNWPVILLSILAVLVVVYIGLFGRLVKFAFTLIRDTTIPLSMVHAAGEVLQGEEYDFPARDGVRLRGTMVSGKGNNGGRGTIVFCHEFGMSRHSCRLYCRGLMEAGFNIFAFDFRNHGDSAKDEGYDPRQWLTDKEVADVLGALAFVDSLDPVNQPLGLFGVSRGGAAAVVTGAQTSLVRAIVTDSVFSTDLTLESHMKRIAVVVARGAAIFWHLPLFWPVFRWIQISLAELRTGCHFPSVRKVLKKMKSGPIFFIHGQKDTYVRTKQAKLLHELAPEPKSLWIVPGARHNRSAEKAAEAYAKRTVEFFDKYLVKAVREGKESIAKRTAQAGSVRSG